MSGVHIALSKAKKRVKELEEELNYAKYDLWQLRGAVLGSWKEAVRCGAPWHKELRNPMVELGYLQHEGWEYSINPKWEIQATEWLRNQYDMWYGEHAEEQWKSTWGEEE